MTAHQIRIRKCNLFDIESIRYLQPVGWDDITFYFKFYCYHNFCYPIVAIMKNRIVGVANGILNENSGWLAHIIVTEDCRHKGIGYQLTNHLVNYLHNYGCRTLLLIATEMGEGLYRRFGFKTVGNYIFFKCKKLDVNFDSSNIREFNPADLNAILELDKSVTGENRSQMLCQFLSHAWVYLNKNKIDGFFLPDFGEGMIIANDDKAGIALLTFKNTLKAGKCVLPDENQAGIIFLKTKGFNSFLKAPRMVLGEKIKWKPACIFSRAGGFYG